MDNFRLTQRQIDALKVLHQAQRDRRFAYRINAIILLGTGWSTAQVSEALLVDDKTIRLWLDKYQHGGTDELLALHYQGTEAKLTETQQQKLSKHLDETTYLTSKEIRHYVKKTYGIEYSASGMKDLLHRLGFVYKKPKHVPGKLDPAEQKKFMKEYKKLLKTKGKNDPIYFGDASHPQFNSIPSYVDSSWQREVFEVEWWSQAGEHSWSGEHKDEGHRYRFSEVGQQRIDRQVVPKDRGETSEGKENTSVH